MRTTIDGLAIGYDDAGSGPPLLLLHAFPLHRRMWGAQLSALAGEARCIAPDLRGFGESAAGPPWTMDRLADDAVGLLDVLGITEPVTVCGVSMGGYIAFALWRRHPERVRALLLCDTRAGPDDEAARRGRQDTIALVRERGAAALADAQLPRMLSARTVERFPERVAALRAMVAGASAAAIIGATEAMLARPDSRPTLATITVPTLLVVGDEDRLTPPEEAEAMQQAIVGSRLERVPDAAHLPPVERPAAFTGLVSEFLAQLDGAS